MIYVCKNSLNSIFSWNNYFTLKFSRKWIPYTCYRKCHILSSTAQFCLNTVNAICLVGRLKLSIKKCNIQIKTMVINLSRRPGKYSTTEAKYRSTFYSCHTALGYIMWFIRRIQINSKSQNYELLPFENMRLMLPLLT
jgi:hypothetical protein